MKRTSLVLLAVIAAVTVSLAAYYRGNDSSGMPQYLTAPVTRGNVIDTIEATGTLEAVETVEVGTQVSGTIKSLHADFNSHVKAGQVVARLEPSLLEAQVEQARASLQRLQADVERAQVTLQDANLKLKRAHELWAMQLIAQTELETAESTARQAEAALKSANAQLVQGKATLNQNQVNLGHSVIQSPIDGIVISRNVDVGQTVAASMSAPVLFVIAKDLGHMRVNASVDEADIGRIAPGQSATFTVDAYPGQSFSGTVAQVRLAPVVEQNVVSYVTIIDVPNPDMKLKPGMTANVTVEIARQEDVLRVPSSALRFNPAGPAARTSPGREDGARVWVLREEQLQPVRVTPGLSDGTTTAIVAGDLQANVRVVTGSAAGNSEGAAAPSNQSPLVPFGGRGRGSRGASGTRR